MGKYSYPLAIFYTFYFACIRTACQIFYPNGAYLLS